MESRVRSLVKAICWQILGLLMMSIIGLMVTGSIALGGAIAALNALVGFATYLAYERFWANVHWGRHG